MLDQIQIVMVNTTHAGNIGAAARAMKNMGLSQLVLVDPIAKVDRDSLALASGANDILDNLRLVATLEEAVADCHLVVGTSARSRHFPWPLLTARQCGVKVREALPAGNKVAIIFGREASGLSNEELHLCNAHVHIPCNSEFSSLNVAQAVQVLCYEMRQAIVVEADNQDESTTEQWGVSWDHPLATHEELDHFFNHLESTLVDLNFLDPKTPKHLMSRLRRLYQRAAPDQSEISIMRGILTATNKATQSATESATQAATQAASQQQGDKHGIT